MANLSFKSYALLGSGRLARHLSFYLKSLGLPFQQWSRNADSAFNSFADSDSKIRLAETIRESSHILFAVRDDALNELTLPWRETGRTLVHFSGALSIPDVHAAHPLMSFSENLETLEWYRQIPFVVDQGCTLERLLPGVPNPGWSLKPAQRPLYHALVSLAGNSSFLLWQEIGSEFENLGLPRQLLAPFLHQVVNNASENSAGGFTGPVARQDWQTVLQHVRALRTTPLAETYRAYLSLADRAGCSIPKELL